MKLLDNSNHLNVEIDVENDLRRVSVVSSGNERSVTNAKIRSWKKPADKPKRPLSAYNIYFQLERDRIVSGEKERIFTKKDVSKVRIVPVDKKPKRSDRKIHGKITFTELARQIGGSWKKLDSNLKKVFEERAQQEKCRYQQEIEVWNQKKNVTAELIDDTNTTPLKPTTNISPITARNECFHNKIELDMSSFHKDCHNNSEMSMDDNTCSSNVVIKKVQSNCQVQSHDQFYDDIHAILEDEILTHTTDIYESSFNSIFDTSMNELDFGETNVIPNGCQSFANHNNAVDAVNNSSYPSYTMNNEYVEPHHPQIPSKGMEYLPVSPRSREEHYQWMMQWCTMWLDNDKLSQSEPKEAFHSMEVGSTKRIYQHQPLSRKFGTGFHMDVLKYDQHYAPLLDPHDELGFLIV